jgi:DNA-binding MarR family transcriptional regulator
MHNRVMKTTRPGTELATVLEQLVRFTRQLATAGGLSPAGASALARLSRDGPQRLTELANAEGVSQPGMTQLVTRLERDGLVHRTASTDDRRGVLVELTDAGLELVTRRRVERAEAVSELLARLDPADQAAITNALPALARLVEARTLDPHHDRQLETSA